MAEINVSSDSGVGAIVSQIQPIMTTMMNLMMTVMLIKMMFEMMSGIAR